MDLLHRWHPITVPVALKEIGTPGFNGFEGCPNTSANIACVLIWHMLLTKVTSNYAEELKFLKFAQGPNSIIKAAPGFELTTWSLAYSLNH